MEWNKKNGRDEHILYRRCFFPIMPVVVVDWKDPVSYKLLAMKQSG